MELGHGEQWRPAWLARTVTAIGKFAAWLTLAMVLLTFLVVLLRYGFSLGWVWLQESVIYLHASVFMLAAAWTLQSDDHVRVDIFYRGAGNRHKAWVDLAGSVFFLVPFCLFMFVIGWDYVMASWRLLEGSREAGGLPLVYLLKTLILVLPTLLLAQAAGIVIHCVRTLRGPGGAQDPA